ncbi:MAG: succinylglutamate desuccinylase/aspartoacylase family protein [Pseudomonadota bacterium]
MRKAIYIGGVRIKPGERLIANIPVVRLYTHAEMTMPAHVIHSKQEGPRLFVSAAVHGDEIIGVEIIHRLLKLKALKRLRGTLIAIPVVNVYGFIQQSRYVPDRRDLNRFFPGSDKGSFTSRLADIFMKEVVANSTHGIDLHAGSNHRINFPHIRAYLDNAETELLARAFGVPVVLNADLRDGSLRQAVMEKGIPILVYEAGEALRFDEIAIRAGVKGIVSVMRAIGMLPRATVKGRRIKPLIARSSTWARAPASGIVRTKIPLGGKVSKGSKIAEVADPFGENVVDVLSPASGIVIGRLNLPLVHRGDALVHIACFDESPSVKATIEVFQEEFNQKF